jgi:hypothetical protein
VKAELIHFDNGFGAPVCGRALMQMRSGQLPVMVLVDEPRRVTCAGCLLKLGELLRARRAGAV